MKRFLIGILIGLLIGWTSVPFIEAQVKNPTKAGPYYNLNDDDDFRGSHAYKWYLTQMLKEIKDVNLHLTAIEKNTAAVKEKLHA